MLSALDRSSKGVDTGSGAVQQMKPNETRMPHDLKGFKFGVSKVSSQLDALPWHVRSRADSRSKFLVQSLDNGIGTPDELLQLLVQVGQVLLPSTVLHDQSLLRFQKGLSLLFEFQAHLMLVLYPSNRQLMFREFSFIGEHGDEFVTSYQRKLFVIVSVIKSLVANNG